jgi:hypothetical protein
MESSITKAYISLKNVELENICMNSPKKRYDKVRNICTHDFQIFIFSKPISQIVQRKLTTLYKSRAVKFKFFTGGGAHADSTW